MQLDNTNIKILNLLQNNGRITNAELSEKAGLSPASTTERVKKLEREGIIRRYAALLDGEKLGLGAVAFVSVSMTAHNQESMGSFLQEIEAIPEVLECHHLAGEADYLLKVVIEDIKNYENFVLTKLTSVKNIGRIQTSFVLSTLKNNTQIPLRSKSTA